MANEKERHARNRLIDETRTAVEKLIREYRKAAKVAARTAAEQEPQGVKRERDLALREAEKFKAYSRQADHEIAQLRLELARLTTPHPIAEAPTDKPVMGIWLDHRDRKCIEVLRWDGHWRGALGTPLYREAEYLPLPEVKP